MAGISKLNTRKPASVTHGHPSTFWRERRRMLTVALVDVNGIKKLGDLADYDVVHLQKSVINRTCMKVRDILSQEEYLLQKRREKLRQLLEREEEYYVQELVTKQELEEFRQCDEREKRVREYEEEIEREKVRECQKALEREKIAKGMQCKRIDEFQLKEMLKKQIEEKKYIDLEEEEKNMMWHQVLVDDVKKKEEIERLELRRKEEQMLEQRTMYDDQIASANRRRNEAIQKEREKENRRTETIKKKMEQEYLEGIRRKKEQHRINKQCYQTDHHSKMCRLQNEKRKEKELDDISIQLALEGLQREKIGQQMTMYKLQIEKQIFMENQERERRMAYELEKEADRINDAWGRQAQNETEEFLRSVEAENRSRKEKMAEDYKRYLDERKATAERERIEREQTMERVRQTAVRELQRQMNNAKEEFRKQTEYRNSLNFQIENNQKVMLYENAEMETKHKPFEDNVETFEDSMARKIDKSPGRRSTNPVHPFARMLAAADPSSHHAMENTRLPIIKPRPL